MERAECGWQQEGMTAADNSGPRTDWSYALITAAYNERQYLEQTIQSVISQTIRPTKWVIVSDGSTDGTDELVRRYVRLFPFVQLCRIETLHRRDFASKVYALNEGATHVQPTTTQYIGHLDADVTFGSDYYATLLSKFERDPGLGVAGGSIYEWNGTAYSPRHLNTTRSVAGAIQMFRQECYQSLKGFKPLKYGGEDWCAEVTARMNGWRVESFTDLEVYHHRLTGSATGFFRNCYRQGLMDFSLGSHPLFEVVRVSRRLTTRPPVIPALIRLAGFLAGYFGQEERPVSGQFLKFLRKEEMARLRQMMQCRQWPPVSAR